MPLGQDHWLKLDLKSNQKEEVDTDLKSGKFGQGTLNEMQLGKCRWLHVAEQTTFPSPTPPPPNPIGELLYMRLQMFVGKPCPKFFFFF